MRSDHPQQLRWNRGAHSQHGPPVSLPDIVPVCETATVYVNGLSALVGQDEPVVPTFGPHLVVRETAFYVRETAGQRFRDHGLTVATATVIVTTTSSPTVTDSESSNLDALGPPSTVTLESSSS